jgi:hypothetical protein
MPPSRSTVVVRVILIIAAVMAVYATWVALAEPDRATVL